MVRRVLGIEYDGGAFSGWQCQLNRYTVQGVLEKALSSVANHPVKVQCAGRTDTGVHALEQVVHFDSAAVRPDKSWLMGTNVNLPDDVKIIWVKPAIDDFNARYSAVARFYRYRILNRPMRSALQRNQVTWHYESLDADRMHQAAQALVGLHDFTSFRAKACQSISPTRHMYFIHVRREGDEVIIELSANAFLHHMVRNIAGVLMAIGSGKRPISWTAELLNLKNRQVAEATASPYGLYLGGVYYPEKYGLTKHPIFDLLPENASRFEY